MALNEFSNGLVQPMVAIFCYSERLREKRLDLSSQFSDNAALAIASA